ncbi:hypothetical protein KAT92_05210, partial [Candidatus Babeliales bacterium]|nr:hypothetical protein [Candidatus Babeliales bacterium]
DSLLQVHTLLKKTYTQGPIPLAADSTQKIGEAKAIKKDEESYNPDPTIGLTEEELDRKIKEMQQ